MSSITIDIPSKLYEGINKLVEEGYFSSIDDFSLHAIRLLAEIYGVALDNGGVKLFDKIIPRTKVTTGIQQSNITETLPKEESSALSNEEKVVLSTFGSAKYEYENTLFMQYQMSALRTGQKPMSKDDFIKILKQLQDKGVLTRIEQGNKILWKKTN